ncbi:hypothetical protein [Corynebacterium felinum]|uniref:hypothetical protein n=1 Tax=Corynebacterium felinum TaxID=131318 RepID=UPI0025B57A87|nr:hypothetical protein [Corynebacterium felinum]
MLFTGFDLTSIRWLRNQPRVLLMHVQRTEVSSVTLDKEDVQQLLGTLAVVVFVPLPLF